MNAQRTLSEQNAKIQHEKILRCYISDLTDSKLIHKQRKLNIDLPPVCQAEFYPSWPPPPHRQFHASKHWAVVEVVYCRTMDLCKAIRSSEISESTRLSTSAHYLHN